ncbi:MAG: stage III sporulation protein AC [Firmicutes bacterium]|jgi:stage III sporulation protein AC|nr:stage III sporulation protein AC [Bacillota bacterium]
MNTELIFQIAGIGILISVLNMVLTQSGRQEQAHLLNIVGVVIVLLMIIPYISQLFATVRTVFHLGW